MSPAGKRGVRVVDVDPFFDQTDLSFIGPDGKRSKSVPYTPGNTWKAANGNQSSYRAHVKNLPALQGHVAYFDGDCDGIIWPSDTFWGFYYLGFGFFLSLLSVLIIHPPFSYPTLPYNGDRWYHYLPDPFMRIYVANIHRDKHGSDSESYNRRGQFQEQKFQEVINDFSSSKDKDSISFADAYAMIKIRRNLMDPFGWFAFCFEWGSMMAILALFGRTSRGMQVDDILGVIDGSILPVLAHEYKKKQRGIALLPQRVR